MQRLFTKEYLLVLVSFSTSIALQGNENFRLTPKSSTWQKLELNSCNNKLKPLLAIPKQN